MLHYSSPATTQFKSDIQAFSLTINSLIGYTLNARLWLTCYDKEVHCALRRIMRKTPINNVPAILNGLKKSPKLTSGQHLRRNSPVTIDTTTNDFNSDQFKIGLSSQFLIVSECISVFRVVRCLKVGTYLSNKGIAYLPKLLPLG